MLRSIAAVVAGFLVTAVLVSVTDALMTVLLPSLYPSMEAMAEGARPGAGGLVLNLAYGTLYAVAGGFAMAWIARRQVMQHLKWLLAVLVIFGVLSGWTSRHVLPPWYSIVVVILGGAGYYAGARLYQMRRGETPVEAMP